MVYTGGKKGSKNDKYVIVVITSKENPGHWIKNIIKRLSLPDDSDTGSVQ